MINDNNNYVVMFSLVDIFEHQKKWCQPPPPYLSVKIRKPMRPTSTWAVWLPFGLLALEQQPNATLHRKTEGKNRSPVNQFYWFNDSGSFCSRASHRSSWYYCIPVLLMLCGIISIRFVACISTHSRAIECMGTTSVAKVMGLHTFAKTYRR